MRPRAFHCDTAVAPTPASEAAAEFPPTASMIASTDISIRAGYSRIVDLSSVPETEIDLPASLRDNPRMGSKEEITARLIDTREALGLTQAQICRVLDCSPTRWSNYEDLEGDRTITMEIAKRLKTEFAITLDWIYLGDPAGLTQELRLKIKAIQAKKHKLFKSA